LGKILPEACKSVEIFSQNPEGLTLQPTGLVCAGRLIFARFFIFLSVNILLKKSLLYLSFEFILKKETILIESKRYSLSGRTRRRNKTYRWKCVGKELG